MRIYLVCRDGKIRRYYVESVKPYVKVGRYKGRVLWAKPDVAKRYIEMTKKEIEEFVKQLPPEAQVTKPAMVKKKMIMFRYSYGLKWIPVHHEYFGAIIEAWSLDERKLERLSERLKEVLISLIEEWLGYPQDLWWFVAEEGEGIQVVDYDEYLLERYYARVEDEDGYPIREEWGELDEL